MEYALVFLSALLVGAIVYWATLRQEQRGPAAPDEQGGMSGAPEGAPPALAAQPGTVYVPLTPATRTWETRVSGVVGILVVVTLSAAALALALYLGGSFVVNLFGDAASNGGLNGGAAAP